LSKEKDLDILKLAEEKGIDADVYFVYTPQEIAAQNVAERYMSKVLK